MWRRDTKLPRVHDFAGAAEGIIVLDDRTPKNRLTGSGSVRDVSQESDCLCKVPNRVVSSSHREDGHVINRVYEPVGARGDFLAQHLNPVTNTCKRLARCTGVTVVPAFDRVSGRSVGGAPRQTRTAPLDLARSQLYSSTRRKVKMISSRIRCDREPPW